MFKRAPTCHCKGSVEDVARKEVRKLLPSWSKLDNIALCIVQYLHQFALVGGWVSRVFGKPVGGYIQMWRGGGGSLSVSLLLTCSHSPFLSVSLSPPLSLPLSTGLIQEFDYFASHDLDCAGDTDSATVSVTSSSLFLVV